MNTPYLTIFFFTLLIAVSLTAATTSQIDPFGIYQDASVESMSRIDQFYHTRSTKPLILKNTKARNLIIGSSRSARLSPANVDLEDTYNASIPGATPTELREILEYAHFEQPLESAIIGWDFEAFLSHTPQIREGFNSTLLNSRNTVTNTLYTLIAHKRTLLSFVALEESHKALNPLISETKPTFAPDGSWQRNQPKNIGPFGFVLISKEKIETFEREKPLTLDTGEVAKTISFCQENNIKCQILITPFHLFHIEILRKAELISVWKQWHSELVTVNAQVAKAFQRQPIPVWGFNAITPAVNEPIATANDLITPWFADNFHFRPKFGDLMLRNMTGNPAERLQGVLLTADNVEAYLDQVLELQAAYIKKDKKVVNRLKKNLKL